MHLSFSRVATSFVMIFVLGVFIFGITMLISSNPSWHPRAQKPEGLVALEKTESRELQSVLEDLRPAFSPMEIETTRPVDPNAPTPGSTRLYNNLLDNLLSSLHYFYRMPEGSKTGEYVLSWKPDDGSRVVTEASLFALESDLSYLIPLEIYSKLRAKVIFEEDRDYLRARIGDALSQEWGPMADWDIGPYFDFLQLYELTGDERYIQWADKYAEGMGANDVNSPLNMARGLGSRASAKAARTASPFYFLHAAMLADWAKRHDPALMPLARDFFNDLQDVLYDPRYKLLWKQVSINSNNSSNRNVTQVFDTLEQLTAVRGMILYYEASGDTAALSLARGVMEGVWGPNSPLLMTPPEDLPANTFYGLYTAFDVGREAKRSEPGELIIDQIFLYETTVLLNSATGGEYRRDLSFLEGWFENAGPIYREEINGYYTFYGENWSETDDQYISAKAAIWMARGLAEDEYYRFQGAHAMAESDE